MILLRDVVGRLGTLKNELLVFVILTVVATHAAAFVLVESKPVWMSVCGVVLQFIGVVFPIVFTAFYVYALLRLPSSQQELLFARTATDYIAKHPAPRRETRRSDDAGSVAVTRRARARPSP